MDWYLSQYACILAGLVVAPIMESTSEAAIESICSRARPKLLIATRSTEAKCRTAMQRGLGKSHEAYTIIIGGALEVLRVALNLMDCLNRFRKQNTIQYMERLASGCIPRTRMLAGM